MKPIQALLALFACAFLPLHAADVSDLTYTTTNGEVTITDCNEAATGELVIPDTITPLSPHESPFDHLTQKANS